MGALHNDIRYQKMCPGVTFLIQSEELLKIQKAENSFEAVSGKLSLAFNNQTGFVTIQP